MTVILNERAWAEEMISSRSLGKKPYETLCRVARYYIDNGLSKKNTRHKMDVFLLQCDPSASLPRWSPVLDMAYTWAAKHEAIDIEKIIVTMPEIDRIQALQGKQLRRLAFTLLCLAKYWNIVTKSNDGWVNNKGSDIMRMANINTSIKRQSMMYYNLREAGLIEFSKRVDNTNVRVCFMESGEPGIAITDFRNVGYQFMMYQGEPYFVCTNCGITERCRNPNKGRAQKYCKNCAAEIAIQSRINSSMRHSIGKNEADKKYTVYMHQFPDGRVYIGRTSQKLKDRWKNGLGYRDIKVGAAINDAGWDNVRHFILYRGSNAEDARAVEAYMIKKYRSHMPQYGYNYFDTSKGAPENSGIIPDIVQIEVDGRGTEIKQN